MESTQTKIDELKTGMGQWRVVVGATIAGIAALIVVCLIYGVAIMFGLVPATLVAIVLVFGLAVMPYYLSEPIQNIRGFKFEVQRLT